MLRNAFSVAVLWMLSFGLMIVVIGLAIDGPHLLLLQRRHAETVGEVVRLLPESHGMVEVRYLVANVTYKRAFPPHLQRSRINEGDSVRVYYRPEDPNVAVIAPPSEILTEQLPSWLAGSLLISVGVVVAVLALRGPGILSRCFPGRMFSARIISAGATVGVLVGLLLSMYAGTLSAAKLVGGAFVISGCVILLRLTWVQYLSWAGLLRSRAFWAALGLAVIGNILNRVL